MRAQLISLLSDLKSQKITFAEVLAFIEIYYQHSPTAFKNGDVFNETTQNQGSAKVFAFAQINELDEENTLSLFAEHYQSVLANPTGIDHQNIRQFMANGWEGLAFGNALQAK